jgi:glucose-1-phosphate cytidylyltransferase
MKAVILAGGKGLRFSEETYIRPKPMIKIGNKPILWHLINYLSKYGVKEFIIALGYKGLIIKEYIKSDKSLKHLKIHLIDTGKDSMTGARIKKIEYLIKENYFLLTYGDGLSDINIKKLIRFHKKNKKIGTMSVVKTPPRWGYVKYSKDNVIKSFAEKSFKDENRINGGFMIMSKKIFQFIKPNKKNEIFESTTLPKLVKNKELMAFKHNGFWQCMDNIREKVILEKIWNTKKAPWKIW